MMGRKRKPSNYPPYVYRGRSAIIFRPYTPGSPRRTIRLAPLDATVAQVWAAYEALEEPVTNTLGWLLDSYINSAQFAERAQNTRSGQIKQARMIKRHPLVGGDTFGNLELLHITPGVIRKYLDKRAETSPVAGNREKALISKAWNWSLERDLVTLKNPCARVSRNKERPRTRYVTDNEYRAWIRYVSKRGPAYLAIVSELAYLCRMRQIEVLTAQRSQITADGFVTLRRKGSRDAVTAWSPRLRQAIDAALDLPLVRGVSTIYLVHDAQGAHVNQETFRTMWGRRMVDAVAELGLERFTCHDLKRKGATDTDQPATLSTGNTEQAARIYDIKRLKADPTK